MDRGLLPSWAGGRFVAEVALLTCTTLAVVALFARSKRPKGRPDGLSERDVQDQQDMDRGQESGQEEHEERRLLTETRYQKTQREIRALQQQIAVDAKEEAHRRRRTAEEDSKSDWS
jgi:hypothetical protein